jgi:MFS family permease
LKINDFIHFESNDFFLNTINNNLGLMVGPLIGGLLFELGGFQLPFFSMGGLLFLEFIAAFFIFPEYRSPYPKRINKNYQAKPQKLSLLKIPEFLLTLHMLFIGSLSIGFIEPSK